MSRALAPLLLFVAVISTLLSNTTLAFAHASERGHILLLPTGYYLFGGAAAVLASFAALTFLPQKQLATLAAWRLPLFAVPDSARLWTSLASFLVMLGLIAAGIFGSRDPLSNPLPLTVWTLIWIGLTLLQGAFGNLWAWFNPWYGPVRLADMVLPKRWRKDYPPALEYWPALILFAGFAWFELIDLSPG